MPVGVNLRRSDKAADKFYLEKCLLRGDPGPEFEERDFIMPQDG